MQIFRKKNDTPWNVIDDEAVVLNLDSGHYYILNETGCRIWELLDGKSSIDDIADKICQEYEVDRNAAQKDTVRIISELEEEKLVEAV